MLAQLNQYDQEELKSIYSKGSLFSDNKQIKEISNVVTQQRNALTAVVTYNNNILKIADSVKLGSNLNKKEKILESSNNLVSNDNDNNQVISNNLISSLQNLATLIDELGEKLKMTDLSSTKSVTSSVNTAKGMDSSGMKLGSTGKALAVAGIAIAGISILSKPKPPRVDQTSEKLSKTATSAVKSAESRSESIKVSENSFSNQFASFIGNMVKTGLIGGIVGAIGGAIGSMMGGEGGSEDYSNLKPAGDSAHAGQAMQYFMSQGWTKEQAAGIVGNLQAESGANLDSNAVGDGGKAYGIAQWHPDRQANFTNKAKYGKIAGSSFEDQLKFVQWELNNTESAAGKALKSARTPQEAAVIIDKLYERSAGTHRSQRIANAVSLAGGKFEANQISSNKSLGTSEAPKGTIWKGKDKDGLITFVSKSNDPSTGKVKYETWTNQDSKHYTISEQDANTQIQSRNLTSNNTKPQKVQSGSKQSNTKSEDMSSFNLPPASSSGGIVALGRALQKMGFRVSEHPAFGGVKGRHSSTGGHYTEDSIDVNFSEGINEATDPKWGPIFDKLAAAGKQAGYHTLWRVKDHYDHIHFQYSGSMGKNSKIGGNKKEAIQQASAPRSQALPKASTQVAIQNAKQKQMAPTIIAKNNIIRQQVKAPIAVSQASGKTNHVRKTMEHFEYLVG